MMNADAEIPIPLVKIKNKVVHKERKRNFMYK